MTMLAAMVSIGTFFGGFWLSGVGRIAGDVLTTTQRAAAAMGDANLDDASREKALRRFSLQLLSSLFGIALRSGVTVGAAVAPILLADAAGLVEARQVFGFLSRWETALVTTVVAAVAYGLRMRTWRTS